MKNMNKKRTGTGDAAGLVFASFILLLIFRKAAELPFNQTGKFR